MSFNLVEKSIEELTSYLKRGVTPKYCDIDGLLVINQRCIRDQVLTLEDARLHDLSKRSVNDEKYVQQYDVLVNSTGVGTLGRVAQVETDITATVDTHVTIVRPDKERVDPHYFGFLMRSIQPRIERLASGSTGQTELRRTALSNIKLKIIDDIPTQKEIASQLSKLDQKIHLNQQTNETLEAMAQTLFKSWFVDFDPVRAKIAAKKTGRDPEKAAMAAIAGISLEQDWNEIEAALQHKLNRMTSEQATQLRHTASLFPDELVDSELGEVPKGWGVKSLDKIADFLNGKAMQKYPPEDGKPTLPVLKIAQLRKGNTEGADLATADIPEKFKIRNGDMIFSWSGSLLVKLWSGGEAALNQHLFKVTSEEYDQWFYYHWTKFHLDNFIRIAESKAVTMGHIKRTHLKEAKCAIPDKELLEIGGQHINSLLQQSVKLNLESNNLAELRNTLLPRLISGELDVKQNLNLSEA